MAVSFFYVALFVAVGAVMPIGFHCQEHGWSWPQACLALFCSINLLVCIWEIGLFLNRDLILMEYLGIKKRVPKGTLPQPIFMFEHVPLAQALRLEHWSKVWSTYSLMDPSYSDQTSFGCVLGPGKVVDKAVMEGLCMIIISAPEGSSWCDSSLAPILLPHIVDCPSYCCAHACPVLLAAFLLTWAMGLSRSYLPSCFPCA